MRSKFYLHTCKMAKINSRKSSSLFRTEKQREIVFRASQPLTLKVGREKTLFLKYHFSGFFNHLTIVRE